MRGSFDLEEMRHFSRSPYTTDVLCLSEKGTSFKGRVLDFSEAGIGFETDSPLEAGCTLKVKNGFGECAGVVKWASRVSGSIHRAGLMFEVIKAEAFSAAITRFLAELKKLEEDCKDPGHDQKKLMGQTVQVLRNMKKASELFEEGGDQEAIRAAQVSFIEKTNPIFQKSYLMNRARTWPQGYPGDYKTLEAVYKNTPQSTGIGFYLDMYFLSTELAVAVRERKETLKHLLLEELHNRKSAKILDIASGSCRELIEIAADIEANDAHVTCLDLDGDALTFSAARLSMAGASMDRFTFRKYNALKMISHERNLKEFGMHDVIYSTGLYDYLESDVLVRLFCALYKLLTPGGAMIISFKDCMRYSTFDYHWLVDWRAFHQRRESEFRKILTDAGIEWQNVATRREESGVILFFTVRKV